MIVTKGFKRKTHRGLLFFSELKGDGVSCLLHQLKKLLTVLYNMRRFRNFKNLIFGKRQLGHEERMNEVAFEAAGYMVGDLHSS